MRCKLFLCLSLIFCLTAACSPQNPRNYMATDNVQRFSEVGETKTVRTGDSIMHYQREFVTDVVEVTMPLKTRSLVTHFIPAGVFPKTGEDEERVFYSRKATSGRVAKASHSSVSDIVFVKKTQKLHVVITGDPLMGGWDTGFTFKKDVRVKRSGEDYQIRSLNYGGSHQKLLTFVFKEGRTSQRITHNMDEGSVFRYGGCEVEIVAYDKQSLTCKVIKEMDIFLK